MLVRPVPEFHPIADAVAKRYRYQLRRRWRKRRSFLGANVVPIAVFPVAIGFGCKWAAEEIRRTTMISPLYKRRGLRLSTVKNDLAQRGRSTKPLAECENPLARFRWPKMGLRGAGRRLSSTTWCAQPRRTMSRSRTGFRPLDWIDGSCSHETENWPAKRRRSTSVFMPSGLQPDELFLTPSLREPTDQKTLE